MEIYTLDRGFRRQIVLDGFSSAIWTERYYGDGDINLVFPDTNEIRAALPDGTLLELVGTEEPMISETHEIDAGLITVTGIALPKWLNNRFIRSTNVHTEKSVVLDAESYGELIEAIVQNWCINSDYLNNVIDMGVGDATIFKIPGLSVDVVDTTGPEPGGDAIPFGPVYDAIRAIAETFQIGLRIRLNRMIYTSFNVRMS